MKTLILAVVGWMLAGAVLAEDVAIVLPNVVKSYTVTTDGKGGAVVTPLAGLVRPGDQPNPQPGPSPQPVPPVLSARAQAIKAASLKVSGDTGRAETAQVLAGVYRGVAKQVADKQITDPVKLEAALKSGVDFLLDSRKVIANWADVRKVLNDEWIILAQNGGKIGEYGTLLDEAADGLEASVPQRNLSPEMIQLILLIIKLIMQFFPAPTPAP